MFQPDQYALLDFGDSRKLERWGPYLLDRGSPSTADDLKSQPEWNADARHLRTSGDHGIWTPPRALPDRWQISAASPGGQLTFEVKPNQFGHLGLFPEHAQYWPWLHEQIQAASQQEERPAVLNLFAYTGAATLAAAASGAQVTHIDSAQNVVAWARRNAELSGMEAAPIRWITEDARKFVLREGKRGNRYQGILLDPPSYGHGPQGQAWRLESDLPELLAACKSLLAGERQFLLATCHTPGYTPEKFAQIVRRYVPERSRNIAAFRLQIPCADRRRLGCGVGVRWNR